MSVTWKLYRVNIQRKVFWENSIFFGISWSVISARKGLFPRRHRLKSVRVRSFSDLYFPVFGLNTENYRVKMLSVKHLMHVCNVLLNVFQDTETRHFTSSINLNMLLDPQIWWPKGVFRTYSPSSFFANTCYQLLPVDYFANKVYCECLTEF